MSFDIKVTANVDDLGVLLNSINEKAIKSAVRKSILRTFTGIRAAMLKEINAGEFYDRSKLPTARAKAKYFRETINASQNTPMNEMYASFKVSSARLNLIYFFAERVPTTKLKENIKVKLKNGAWVTLKAGRQMYGARTKVLGKIKTHEGDFIGNLGKKNAQVYRRKENGKIYTQTGPSLAVLFAQTNAASRIQKEADERMQRELETNIDYYLAKI